MKVMKKDTDRHITDSSLSVWLCGMDIVRK